MHKFPLLMLAALALGFFASSRLSAQDQPSKVVYFDSQEFLTKTAAGKKVASLLKQEASDLANLQSKMQPLLQKLSSGQKLSDDEKNQLSLYQQSYKQVGANDDKQITAAEQPIQDAIDAVAKKNHYTIVIDGSVANNLLIAPPGATQPAPGHLIAYGAPGADITEQIIAQLGK
jgi:Skp family chaperone for outer membrane proteins